MKIKEFLWPTKGKIFIWISFLIGGNLMMAAIFLLWQNVINSAIPELLIDFNLMGEVSVGFWIDSFIVSLLLSVFIYLIECYEYRHLVINRKRMFKEVSNIRKLVGGIFAIIFPFLLFLALQIFFIKMELNFSSVLAAIIFAIGFSVIFFGYIFGSSKMQAEIVGSSG